MQHVIANDGPDVSFATVKLSAGGRDFDCLVIGEFFNERTSIYWTESEEGSWADPNLVSRERERKKKKKRDKERDKERDRDRETKTERARQRGTKRVCALPIHFLNKSHNRRTATHQRTLILVFQHT
ncbi:hypothetical protein E2C01_093853 [Portunus trituberculatus]|uniref:Uncharacterized protein n=1 Tax=Portunus trituberculatus TaxID=210409 RepID=A0A5B7JNU6_PORTR|nr:hypothetical protein [Portunus trituberculatus]